MIMSKKCADCKFDSNERFVECPKCNKLNLKGVK